MSRGHKEPYTVTPVILSRLNNRGHKICRKCKDIIIVGDEVRRTLFHIYHKRCLKWI